MRPSGTSSDSVFLKIHPPFVTLPYRVFAGLTEHVRQKMLTKMESRHFNEKQAAV